MERFASILLLLAASLPLAAALESFCVTAPAGTTFVTDPIELGFQLQFGACTYSHIRLTSNGYITLGREIYLEDVPNMFKSPIPVIAAYGADMENATICYHKEKDFWNLLTVQNATNVHLNKVRTIIAISYSRAQPASPVEEPAYVSSQITLLADNEETRLLIHPPRDDWWDWDEARRSWPGSAERAVVSGYSYGARDNPGIPPHIVAASPLYAQYMNATGYAANFSYYRPIVQNFSYYFKFDPSRRPPDTTVATPTCNQPSSSSVDQNADGALLPFKSDGVSGQYLESGMSSSKVIQLPGLNFGGCIYNFAEINSGGYIRLLTNPNQTDEDTDGTPYLTTIANSKFPVIAPFAATVAPVSDNYDNDGSVFYSLHTGNLTNFRVAERVRLYEQGSNFMPTLTLLVTYHLIKSTNRNYSITAQAAIASDGSQTVVLFNYAADNSVNQVWRQPEIVLIGYSYGKSYQAEYQPTILAALPQDGNSGVYYDTEHVNYEYGRGNIIGNTGQIGQWYFKLRMNNVCGQPDPTVKQNNFLPHGRQLRQLGAADETCFSGRQGQKNLKTVSLPEAIPFGADLYSKLQVSAASIIFLGDRLNQTISRYEVPDTVKLPTIIPIMAELSSTDSLEVCYAAFSNSTSPQVLAKVASLMKAIKGSTAFQPTSAFILTGTVFQGKILDKSLTYQATLVSNGLKTAVLLVFGPGMLSPSNAYYGYLYDFYAGVNRRSIISAEHRSSFSPITTNNTGLPGVHYFDIGVNVANNTLFPYGDAAPALGRFLVAGLNPVGEITIPTVRFGACNYSHVQITSNGYIRLLKNSTNPQEDDDSADDSSDFLTNLFNDVNPIIAPFAWTASEIGNTSTSESFVSYSLHSGSDPVNRLIGLRVQEYQAGNSSATFIPTFSLVVTYKGLKLRFTNSTITAQLVLTTNSDDTYVLFNYARLDNGKIVSYNDFPQIGYSYGAAHNPLLRNVVSFADHFDEETPGNTGMLGRWYFKLEKGESCLSNVGKAQVHFLPHGVALKQVSPDVTEVVFDKTEAFEYVKFARSLPFGSCRYENAFVFFNGHLALGSNASGLYSGGYSALSTYNTRFPVIAPLSTYYSTLNSRSSLLISQHTNETSPFVIDWILQKLRSVKGNNTFQPSFALSVTWHNMRFGRDMQHISFQAVVFTDGENTGLFFAYSPVPGGINASNLAVGFAYGYIDNPDLASARRIVVQRASWERAALYDMHKSSNTEFEGLWYFDVNTTHGACRAELELGLTWPPSTTTQSTTPTTTPEADSSLLPSYQTSRYPFTNYQCFPSADDASYTIISPVGIPYGGCLFNSLSVSTNGYIYLVNSGSYYSSISPMLAPFHVDLVTQNATSLCYTRHSVNDPYMVYINNRLNASSRMNITLAFVITYYRVVAYRGGQIATFQVVLFTDGQKTALFFNYDTADAPWFTSQSSVNIGYSYGSSLDPYGNYSTILTYPRPFQVSTALTMGQSSNINRRGVYYYPIRNLRQEIGATCEITSTPYWYRTSTRRIRTTPVLVPNFRLHPLAVCDNSSNITPSRDVTRQCRCRHPFVGNASFCLGASPDVVMFPYSNAPSRTCLNQLPTASSSSDYISIRFGGISYANFRVVAGGYIMLDNSYYSSSSFASSWRDVRRNYYSAALIAPFGADLGFYSDLSSVCYSVYYSYLSNAVTIRARNLIRNYTADSSFVPSQVVVITYDKMARNSTTFLSSSYPIPAITAQVVLIVGSSGNQFSSYINFNYEFTDYVQFKPLVDSQSEDNDWQVAFDFSVPSSSYTYRENKITKTTMAQLMRSTNSSIIDSNALDQLVGNTGVLGSWLFRVDGPNAIDPVIRRSINAAPQSADELLLVDVRNTTSKSNVSPLAICKRTANTTNSSVVCRCRSPYVGNGTYCMGTKPDVIMFPYGNNTNQFCLTKFPATVSPSSGVAGIYYGGMLYNYVKVAARGYINLDSYYSYGGNSYAPRWRDVSSYSYSTLLAVYGYDFEFYYDVSNVCYSVHNVSSFSTASQSIVARASQLVRNYTNDAAFSADTVVVVTYEKMAPPYYWTNYNSLQREAVTAQLVIISSVWPRRTYVNFNYEFTDYVNYRPFTDNSSFTNDYTNYTDWQQATFDFPQAYSSLSLREPKITKWMTMPLVRAQNSSIINANAFDQLVGNTGILGSWLFRVDGPAAVDPVIRRANNSVPQSLDQLFVNVPVIVEDAKPPKPNVTVSPLVTCDKTSPATASDTKICKCRSPYIQKNSICVGASPDVVMFPYAINPRICLTTHSPSSISNSISVRAIKFGGLMHEYVHVGAGGFVLMARSFSNYYSNIGKNWNSWSSISAAIAAYGGDLGFSDNSSVCYTFNSAGNGFQPILDRANRLVKSHTDDKNFNAQSVLVVTYEKMVPQSNSDEHAISSVPESVTAQIVIISAGADRSKTYVNFNYEFNDYVKVQPFVESQDEDGSVGWEQAFSVPSSYSSNYGLPTLVRLTTVSSSINKFLVQSGNSSIVNPHAFDQLVGNTGILGSWLYRVDGESVVDPVVRRANNSAPQSLDDITYVRVVGGQSGGRLNVTARPSGDYRCSEESVMLGRVVISKAVKDDDPLPILNSQLKQHYGDAIVSAGYAMSLVSATVDRISIESLVKLDLEVKVNLAIPCDKTTTFKQNLQSLKSGRLLEATVQYILSKSGYFLNTQKTQFEENCWPPRKETVTSTCASSNSAWWVDKIMAEISKTADTSKIQVAVTSVKINNGLSLIDYELRGECDDRLILPAVSISCAGNSDHYVGSYSSSVDYNSSSSKMFIPLALVLVIASVSLTLLTISYIAKWKKRRSARNNAATIEMHRAQSRTTLASEMPQDGLETALIRRTSRDY